MTSLALPRNPPGEDDSVDALGARSRKTSDETTHRLAPMSARSRKTSDETTPRLAPMSVRSQKGVDGMEPLPTLDNSMLDNSMTGSSGLLSSRI